MPLVTDADRGSRSWPVWCCPACGCDQWVDEYSHIAASPGEPCLRCANEECRAEWRMSFWRTNEEATDV